jgi:pimeloyl-ACP methyl ester carboxylesterase
MTRIGNRPTEPAHRAIGRVALIDAGHFVWEQAPTEYASIILDSVSGYRS